MTENFRDTLATIDKRGNRIWVYPVKPKGKYYSARTVVSFVLLAFLFLAPFIKVGGHPLVQLDILNRQFYLFGLVFWPQDLHLFVLTLITFAVFVILFTSVLGRLFCGWACPQTIFLEMVFRKIEYLIEGNGPTQRRLDLAPWTASKVFKKTAKLAIFFAISFLIGNIFLAYIIGVDELGAIITSPPSEHLTGFIAMLIFSGVFFFVFTWFREQACTVVCPYGRLQSVLLDTNSVVVHYDFKRGEPRGPWTRTGGKQADGDCIDCHACVRVCPTGIDIRNGTQLECINCTACMDACDKVMTGIKLPTKLIRYSSYDAIAHGLPIRFTTRIKLYSVIFLILLTITTTLLILRSPVEATILRAAGSLYTELPDGKIRNLYTIKLINKTPDARSITLVLDHPAGVLTVLGPALELSPEGEDETVFSIEIPKENLLQTSEKLTVKIMAGTELIEGYETTFVGPVKIRR